MVERRHRHLEAAAELADDVFAADAHVVEEDLRRVLRAQPELALDRSRLETGCIRRHDEARDPARAWLTSACEDECVGRPRAEGDEDLLSGEQEAVAVGLGAGLEA